MSKLDWKQAMLNEAEASENAEWAEETRRTAFFNPWEVSWRQMWPFFLICVGAAALTTLLSHVVADSLTSALCSQVSSCSSVTVLVAALLVGLYAVCGYLFYVWDIRNFSVILFVVVASQRLADNPVFQVINTGNLAFIKTLLFGVGIVVLPTALTYRWAYDNGLKRARPSA